MRGGVGAGRDGDVVSPATWSMDGEAEHGSAAPGSAGVSRSIQVTNSCHRRTACPKGRLRRLNWLLPRLRTANWMHNGFIIDGCPRPNG